MDMMSSQVQSGQTSLDAVLHNACVDKINQLGGSINLFAYMCM